MSGADLLVSVDRLLPAPPEVVFGALTDPAMFAQWIGPDGSVVTVDELTLALGGRLAFRILIPGMDVEFSIYGYYEEIDPPNRLVHSWAVEGEDEISTVVFTLEPRGTSTHLELTHHGLTTPEDVANNDSGWRSCLDRLETLITA